MHYNKHWPGGVFSFPRRTATFLLISLASYMNFTKWISWVNSCVASGSPSSLISNNCLLLIPPYLIYYYHSVHKHLTHLHVSAHRLFTCHFYLSKFFQYVPWILEFNSYDLLLSMLYGSSFALEVVQYIKWFAFWLSALSRSSYILTSTYKRILTAYMQRHCNPYYINAACI